MKRGRGKGIFIEWSPRYIRPTVDSVACSFMSSMRASIASTGTGSE